MIKFSQKYTDGFTKLLRIYDIQKELQNTLNRSYSLKFIYIYLLILGINIIYDILFCCILHNIYYFIKRR